MGKNLKSMVLVRFGFLYGQGSVRFWFLLSCCLKSSGSVRVLPINGSVRVRVRFLVLLAGSIRTNITWHSDSSTVVDNGAQQI
jgi:hypothetical protein